MKSNIDWQSLVFQSSWLLKLDKLAIKRFGDGGLAQEASTYVIEKMSSDNWKCLASFKGKCKAESYLHTVASNFLEEFSRQRFGRPRPPEWLKRQGTLWVQIWKMVCLERQMIQSVIELLSFKNIRDQLIIKQAIKTIKARLPWCGESRREITQNTTGDEENDPSELITDEQTPESQLTDARYSDILLLISSVMNDNPTEQMFGNIATARSKDYANKNQLTFECIQQKLALTDEEKIILRMLFQDGLKKSVIAKSLGLKDHLPGQIAKNALTKISQIFKDIGINLDEIHEISYELSH